MTKDNDSLIGKLTEAAWQEDFDGRGSACRILELDTAIAIIRQHYAEQANSIEARIAWSKEHSPSRSEIRSLSEDAEFESKLKSCDKTHDYVGLREYAGVISERLRQMDKRAKAANTRADALAAELATKRESIDQDVEMTLKIANDAIKRNGVLKDALRAIMANPYAHSEDVNCARYALNRTEGQKPC